MTTPGYPPRTDLEVTHGHAIADAAAEDDGAWPELCSLYLGCFGCFGVLLDIARIPVPNV